VAQDAQPHSRWPTLVHTCSFITSQADADSVVREIRTNGGKAEAVGSDLEVPEGPSALAAKMRTLAGDRLDVVVANAGNSKAARIEDHTVADFARFPMPILSQESKSALMRDLRLIVTPEPSFPNPSYRELAAAH